MASNQPDRQRILNRLSDETRQCAGRPRGSVVPGMDNVTIDSSISTNELCLATSNFDFWSEIHGNYYRQKNQTVANQGAFGLSYFGVDYSINHKVVVGVLVEGDYINQMGTVLDMNRADGKGWMTGPYISAKIAPDLYLHTRAAWGKSTNNINVFGSYQDSFQTKRYLYNAELVGDWSLNQWRLTPSAGLTWYNETQNNFINALNVFIPEQQVNLGQVNAGPEISYVHMMENARQMTWRLSFQALYNLNGSSPGVNDIVNGLSSRIKLGTEILFPSGLSLTPMVQYDGIGAQSFSAIQAQIQINVPLDRKLG